MSSRIGPSDADRYGWPDVPSGVLAETYTPIARRIARAHVRTVGFLAAGRALAGETSLAPFVAAVGEALLGFLSGDVGIVDSWPTWPWGEALEKDDRSIFRQRRLAPRIVELAPTPCGDPEAATVALQATLARLPAGLAVTLLNLAGYAEPGVIPSAADHVERTVVVVASRRTHVGGLVRMTRSLGQPKNLGVVLID